MVAARLVFALMSFPLLETKMDWLMDDPLDQPLGKPHNLFSAIGKYAMGRFEMIGQAGLTLQPYKGAEVLEIGYLPKEGFWHRRYAIEAAMGCKNTPSRT